MAADPIAETAQRVRRGLLSATAGDRPYLAVLLVVLGLGALMLSGPIHHHLGGRDRVELLETKQRLLEREIAALEERRDDLNDPAQIELIAREQLGLVAPGEVAYIVVAPQPQRPQVAPGAEPEAGEGPWYRRLWEALGDAVP